MTSKTDPLELLANFRPTDEFLDQDWPGDQRADMRDRIARSGGVLAGFGDPVRRQPVRRRRKQWSAVAGLVAAAAVALLAFQLAQPASDSNKPFEARDAAARVALQHLASTAQTAPTAVVKPGQFIRRVSRDSYGATRYTWTSYDGKVWGHDINSPRSQRDSDYWTFRATPVDINNPTPRFLATLPTDPARLQSYLLSHVCGSDSRDEATFVGIGDMLRGGFAPRALRVAAIQVLEGTGHITTHPTHDALGRAALQIDFVDNSIRPDETQSLLFDPRTSALLADSSRASGTTFVGTYSNLGIVSQVPPKVVARAVPRHNVTSGVTPGAQSECAWDAPSSAPKPSARPTK